MLSILIFILLRLKICEAQLTPTVEEQNVLTPPYFNIATGKKIESTATCGEEDPQVFCKLTGGPNEYGYGENLYQGQFCDVCDSLDPTKSHPINNAIDGTEKWWQSPPLSQGTEYNAINITLHLGQVFHVAYTIIKFANSPRAGTWVLERSSDYGKTFQPWQYFANSDSDCYNLFGIDAFEDITRDDSVVCTSEYSDAVPLERGEVIVSMINGRPGANNFSHSPTLQEWTKATDIRLRLLRTKTLLGHLMAVQRQDPTVTRRYYYSIKDISIGGRCVCNGHADTCTSDPDDKYKSKCYCRHHTCGDSCEYCCPGFVQKAWRAAIPESANECEECNCYGHTTECMYDEEVAIRRLSIDKYGNYEGGGVCLNCSHNTAGINCEKCMDGFYRPAEADLEDPNGCRPCDCDSTFTVGTCEPITGRCYCKPEYAGDRCDRCAPGYIDFPECEPCPCYFNGTRDGVCIPSEEGCPCKYNYAGMYCSECAPGFYDFPDCIPCACIGQGAASEYCDQITGQCKCDQGFGGINCDQCSPGFYNYPTCQSCSCLVAFSTAQVCDPTTGECLCTDFITGESCNQCIPGYFDFPNCRECECSPEGSVSTLCDAETGRCECKPNYQGLNCDACAPEFYGYPNCLPCNCDTRGSARTTCDSETGQCSCYNFITGGRCQQCIPDYFNFPQCEDCKCNPMGINAIIPGECLAFTTGQCDCKEHVIGEYCDSCDSLHYNLTRGCIDCGCFVQGTLDGVASCDSESGDCPCKIYAHTQSCAQCLGGFYGLENANYLGCDGCRCDVGGAYDDDCDTINGQCRCKYGVTGRRCDRVEEGRYFPTLLQYQFEVEDGKTMSGDIMRFGFDNSVFAGYSGKGYAEFSVVQSQIIVTVTVPKHGLYRSYFHYVQPYGSSVVNLTFTPVSGEGSVQSFEVAFEETTTPKLFAVSEVVVLTQGQWNVIIGGEQGLLVDYFLLLPSEYYEPSVLQAKVVEPCKPQKNQEKECIMYTHPEINHGASANLTEGVNKNRLLSLSNSHPIMAVLDGNSVEGYGELQVTLAVESTGLHVLVLEYASTSELVQTVEAIVSAGIVSPKTKFNIYSCNYSFLCRQVGLTLMNEVMVYDIAERSINVQLKLDPGELAYITRIYAIPYAEWDMEYVEPKRRCIVNEGSSFGDCISWTYPVPDTGRRFEAGVGANTSTSLVPTATDATVKADFIDSNNTVQIDMNLLPGKYVFVLHYFNPYHLAFSPSIVLAAGVTYEGGANVTYCPNGDGCRAVFDSDGALFLNVAVPTQTMTITVPHGKSFWLDYVLAIPEDSYDASFLDLMRYDHSRRFFKECYGTGSEGLLNMAKNPSEFCKAAVFTLTMHFSDGAMTCECNELGTVNGLNASCEAYGGQCRCRTNVVGRHCEQCAVGYHGFPDCKPCDCNGTLCDELNGNCICPPNTLENDCTICAPFTHSYHPLAGCRACDCNNEGVEDAADLGCSKETGQCRCKDNVEGPKCDRCSPGYFYFPECRPCVCNEQGIVAGGCDPVSGQCLCKENVEGQQCDRCKSGTFYLDGSNALGCTACFCFGVSRECSGTLFPMTEVIQMYGWKLMNSKTSTPDVRIEGQTASVDFSQNGGAVRESGVNLYWTAPPAYLGDKLASYGGELQYTTNSRNSETSGRGDSAGESVIPAPQSSSSHNVILEGNGLIIGSTNRGGGAFSAINLTETDFVHLTTGNPVKREDMMFVLSDLSSLRIRASSVPQATFVSISNVRLWTTDYQESIASGATIPTVEDCVCPKGYSGDSCQLCSHGHYREFQGPYLGYCAECDCYGHCDRCDISGLIDRNDCLHNTDGDKCEKCQDGFVGDPTNRDPDACQQCPCPHASAEGNYAKTCFYDDTILVCNCKPGYTGSRCEQCDLGYFGNPMVIGGDCTSCNCNGNLDLGSDLEPCDSITGKCSDCKFNTGGKYCERCVEGYYGDAVIGRNCSKCSCNECGTLQCDHLSGACTCKPHVIGENCDHCDQGFYDLTSCTGCHRCGCDVGATSDECDEVTGQCKCAPNVVGVKCDKCSQGHWDYSAMGCEPCNCHNDGDCNPVNGECQCPSGITGRQCDKCETPRYILPPGGTNCEPCDDCTHVLLDDIEMSTEKLRETSIGISKVSVGVNALKKLYDLQLRANNVEMIIKEVDGQMDEVNYDGEKLLKYKQPRRLEEIGSGSGFEESSGETLGLVFYKEERIGSYDSLLADLDDVEDAVSAMCNHTESLLETVEKTSGRSIMLGAKFSSASDDIKQSQAEFLNLLEKLTAESSGEDLEYTQKFAEFQMVLERMKQRNFSIMNDLVNLELAMAEEVFLTIRRQFILPSLTLEKEIGDLEQELFTKFDKLRKMRNMLSAVVGTATETTALNSINRRELELARTTVLRIRTIHATINEIIVDSERRLSSTSTSTRLALKSETLLKEINKLVAAMTPFGIDMNNTLRVVSEAEDKTVMLYNHSQVLINLIGLVRNDSNISSAISASNRYATIFNTMEMAKSLSDKLELDSVAITDELRGRNLTELAGNMSNAATDLLYKIQMSDSELVTGHDKLDMVRKQAEHLGKLVDDLTNRLNHSSTSARLGKLRTNRDDEVEKVRNTSGDARIIADKIMVKIAVLRSKMDEAPDTNITIEDELTAVDDDLAYSPDILEEALERAAELKGRASLMDRLTREAALDEKMKKIRKLIELSRSASDNVKVAMEFSGGDDLDDPSTLPVYVQSRLPVQILNSQDYLKVELYVNATTAPDSSILYLGDVSSNAGDYLALETRNGKVHFNYKVGDREDELVSNIPINDSDWHHIIIQRMGVRGKLEVQLPNPGGEAIFNEGAYRYDTINSEDTYADNFKSNMPTGSNVLVIGGMPFSRLPSGMQNHRMTGCVRGVAVNGEKVGMWNFVSYNGPQPGQSCRSGFQQTRERMWRFRGYDSYLQASAEQLRQQRFTISPTSRNTIVQFRFKTIQTDALLFLFGQTEEQFFAVELRNGKFVVTCNFGWDKPKQAVARDFPDVNTQPQQLAIKAGIVQIGPARRMVVLAINSVLKLNITFTDWSPNVRGDGWVGGVHRYDIPEELRKHVKTIDQHFRGCLGYLAFHFRTGFNMYSAHERMGITPGCRSEVISSTIITIAFDGNDYISVPTLLSDVVEVDGLVGIRTEGDSGTIILAQEQANDDHFVSLSMVDGYIVLTDGENEIRSDDTYNDGRPHTIKFDRYADGSLRLIIDGSFSRELESLAEGSRRKKRRARPREGVEKITLFSESAVHVFVGGYVDGPYFSGCIGNIHIEGATDKNGLLTEGVRCGFTGNTRCFGKPKFNRCHMESDKEMISAKISSNIVTAVASSENGEISAFEFTNGGTLDGDNEINRNKESEEAQGQRKRRRGRGRNRDRSGNRVKDTILGIDAAQLYDNRYDRGCQLSLVPETRGWNYTGLGYSEYTVNKFNPRNWRFSLTMRTVEREGIVFFMSPTGYPGFQEHVAIYLVGGKVTLSVRFGERRIRIKSYRKYNDGHWHDITFQLKASRLQIIIDDTIRNEEFRETSYTFSNMMIFYVGGLEETEMEYANSFISRPNITNFRGCIQNLAVNDQLIGVSTTARLLVKINVSLCFESVTEEGIFFTTSDQNENGAYMMVYNTYNVQTNLDVSMQIRPRVQTGVLVAVGSQTGNFFQLTLIDGKVVARVQQGSDMLMSVYDPSDYNDAMCDGNWHKIHVIKAKNILTLTVDGNMVTPIEQGRIEIRSCDTDGPLFIGGVPVDANVGKLLVDRRQYTGCMKEIRIDHFKIKIDTPIAVTPGVSGNACPMY